jgi:DNA ligase D-like protein (predicted ligase)
MDLTEIIVKPMEPMAHPQPFDSEDYLFEVKWDGVRMIAFCQNGKVRLQNRRLRDRTSQYPELQVLGAVLGLRQCVLDGEVIAMRNGTPSFSRVMERDRCTDPGRISQYAQRFPVEFMVFDIIMLDDTDLSARPLHARKPMLQDLLRGFESPVHTVDSHQHKGVSLYEATRANALEGIVAKRIDSPYVQGGKSRHWLKIKHTRYQCCVVGGYAKGAGGTLSLLAGVYYGESLRYAGRVSSGISVRDHETFTWLAKDIGQDTSPFVDLVHARNVTWLLPALTFVSEFTEWTDDMRMRAPRFKGFSTAKPTKCVIG